MLDTMLGIDYKRIQEVTKEEYPNVFHIRDHINNFTDEERATMAEYDHANHAWYLTLRYKDWLASNAFGGKRSGDGPVKLRELLEENRLWCENFYGCKVKKITNPAPITEEYYNLAWKIIDANREASKNT